MSWQLLRLYKYLQTCCGAGINKILGRYTSPRGYYLPLSAVDTPYRSAIHLTVLYYVDGEEESVIIMQAYGHNRSIKLN